MHNPIALTTDERDGRRRVLIRYAPVSRNKQDLTAQLDGFGRLGVERDRIYTDKLTGRNADRPGLREAIGLA